MMNAIHTQTAQVVSKLPICHFCLDEAKYEAKTVYGYRASLCARDFKKVGVDAEHALKLIVIEPAPKLSFIPRNLGLNFGLTSAACA